MGIHIGTPTTSYEILPRPTPLRFNNHCRLSGPVVASSTSIATRIVTMNDFPTLSGKPKLQLLWPDQLNLPFMNTAVPQRYRIGRRRTKSKSGPGNEEITALKTSFNAWDGVRDFQKHKWATSDLQYVFLGLLALFCLWIAPPAPGVKLLAVVGSVWLMLMPATRQFFLPSSMIWIWLLYFFCSR